MGLISENKVGQIAKVLDKDNGDVGKFLNRILGLSVQRQNLVRFSGLKPFIMFLSMFAYMGS